MGLSSNSSDAENQNCIILFMDLVGYSRLPAPVQLKAASILKNSVKNALTFQNLSLSSCIILPTGDGMIVALKQNLIIQALEIASMIQKELPGACSADQIPLLGLRIGLHIGEVYFFKDINGLPNLVGHAINQGQRIMDFGDAGHILCSTIFGQEVSSILPELKTAIIPVGTHYDKHGFAYEVSNIIWHDAGNPVIPTRGQHTAELEKNHQDLVKTITSLGLDYTDQTEFKDLLTMAKKVAQEWRHAFIGLEHFFAIPLAKQHEIALMLSSRSGIKSKELLSILRYESWEGKLENTWSGMPLTPSATKIWQSLVTGTPEEVISLILRSSFSLPTRLLMNLAPAFDPKSFANELWPIESEETVSRTLGPVLQICNGPEDGRLISLSREEMTLGRSAENQLAFSYDSKISRHHARFFFQEESWWIEDLHSTNGVKINGQRINGPAKLNHGDIILAGNLNLAHLMEKGNHGAD